MRGSRWSDAHVGLDFSRAVALSLKVAARCNKARRDVFFCTWALHSGEATLSGYALTLAALGLGSALIKQSPPLKRRWFAVAALPLCALLPACPVVDDYFIQTEFAGSGPLATAGGASALGAAGMIAAASAAPDAGSDAAQNGASGGTTGDAGSSSHDAGSTSSDAGNGGASSSGASSGGASSSGASSSGASSSGASSSGASSSGASGTTGGGGAGNSTSAGGGASEAGSGNLPQPACKEGVVKGSPCMAGVPFCYKGCGPDNLGHKTETCENGEYVEQSGCTFPVTQSYSCYKLPVSLPTECPATVPRGGRPCQVAACTVCFGGNSAVPQYQDSTGAQKPGYCVCSEAGTWTCGSVTSWPCPNGQGCG